MPPKTLGRFELAGSLGRGGSAAVYRATDTATGDEVAIKILGREVSRNVARRFLREASLLERLDHPRIVTIHGVHEEDGHLFCSLEYMPGGDLGGLIRGAGDGGEPVALGVALGIAADVLAALHYLEGLGICHRDIKPANVLLDGAGRASLTDFGLAYMEDVTRLTRTGHTVGTLKYMSPEQLLGEEVDRRSDLYQVGLVLYELLHGGLPHGGDSSYAQAMARASEELPLELPEATPARAEVEALLRRACAPAREDRFDRAEDFLAAVHEVAHAAGLELAEPPLTRPGEAVVRELQALSGVSSGDQRLAAYTGSTTVHVPTRARGPSALAFAVGGALVGAGLAALLLRGDLLGGEPLADAKAALAAGRVRRAARHLEVALPAVLADPAATRGDRGAELRGVVAGTLEHLDAGPSDRALAAAILDRVAGALTLEGAAARRVGDALLAQATGARASGATTGALRLLEQAAAIGAGVAPGELLRAEVLLDLGRAADAEEALARALELRPDLVDAHRLLGELARRRGAPAEAEASYRRVLVLDPRDPAAAAELAGILADRGDEASIREATRLLEPDGVFADAPPGVRARRLRGQAALARARGDAAAAGAALEEAHRTFPTVETWRELAEHQVAARRGALAAETFLGAVRAGARDLPTVLRLVRRAVVYRHPEAYQDGMRALAEVAPEVADAVHALHQAMRASRGASPAASQALDALEVLRPGDPLVHAVRGQQALARGEAAAAVANLEEATRALGDAAPVQFLLGEARRARGGDMGPALEAYRAALASLPEHAPSLSRILMLRLGAGQADHLGTFLEERREAGRDDTGVLIQTMEGLLRQGALAELEALAGVCMQLAAGEEALAARVAFRVRRTQGRLMRPDWEGGLASVEEALAEFADLLEGSSSASSPATTGTTTPPAPAEEPGKERVGLAHQELRQYLLFLKLLPTVGISGIRVPMPPAHLRGRKRRLQTRLSQALNELQGRLGGR